MSLKKTNFGVNEIIFFMKAKCFEVAKSGEVSKFVIKHGTVPDKMKRISKQKNLKKVIFS
jgi:hypothetical protein